MKQNIEDQLQSIANALEMMTAQHTRKQVQMHAVTSSIAHNFVQKSRNNFGLVFHNKKGYFTPLFLQQIHTRKKQTLILWAFVVGLLFPRSHVWGRDPLLCPQ